jgi:hypothetical protein
MYALLAAKSFYSGLTLEGYKPFAAASLLYLIYTQARLFKFRLFGQLVPAGETNG